jgi:hypothetical protein
MADRTGHCLCGAIGFRFSGSPLWSAYCHCESCRRNCSAPVTAFLSVPLAGFEWTGGEPAAYVSSPPVRRRFCAHCGTPMAYEHDDYPEEIHLYAASLTDPSDFAPERHDFAEERLPWFDVKDHLPRE